MRLQKLTALLLVVALLLSMAACGSNAANNSPTQAPAQTQATDAPATSSATDPPPAEETSSTDDLLATPKEDFGGRHFTFASWFGGNFMDSNTLEPSPTDEGYSMADLLHYDAVQRFMEEYNCTLELVIIPSEEIFPNFTASVMAGDPLADMVMTDPGNMASAIKNQMVMSIDEYIPADADPFTTQKWTKPGIVFMDKSWYLDTTTLEMDAYMVGFNLDILRAIGEEDPRVLLQNNQWTWDKFRDIAIKAVNTTDSAGVQQYWGMTGWTQWMLEAFIASNDGYLVSIQGENGLTNPKTIRAIEFFDQIFNVDKIAYLANNDIWDWGGNMDAYQQGRSVFFFYVDWMGGVHSISYDWGVVPFPKGPDNTVSGVYPTYLKGFNQAYMMPRGTKNPEQIYPLLEKVVYGYYGDEKDVENEGIRGWFERDCFISEEDVEMNILLSREGKKPDYSANVSGLPIGDIMTNVLVEKTMTPAQAVETYRQPFQDAIDEFFK